MSRPSTSLILIARCCVPGVGARCASSPSLTNARSSRKFSPTWGCGHIPLMPRQTMRSRSQRCSPGAVFARSHTEGQVAAEKVRVRTQRPLRSVPHHPPNSSLLTAGRNRATQRLELGFLEGVAAGHPESKVLSRPHSSSFLAFHKG